MSSVERLSKGRNTPEELNMNNPGEACETGGTAASHYIEPIRGETIYSETENNLFKLHEVKK